MEKDKNLKNKKDSYKDPIINDMNGLNISYDKEELKKFYPNLISELYNKKRSMQINSVNMEIEHSQENINYKSNENLHDELINPGIIDFIRRCTTKEQALEILDYQLKSKELTQVKYDSLRNLIIQEGDLKKLIDEGGGFKRPGYYYKKYYKKRHESKRLKEN